MRQSGTRWIPIVTNKNSSPVITGRACGISCYQAYAEVGMAGAFSYDKVKAEEKTEQRVVSAAGVKVLFCLRTIQTEGAHPRISAFYERLAASGEKRAAALAEEYAAALAGASSARERCSLREPRLTMETELIRLPLEDERNRLLLRTRVSEWRGARRTDGGDFFAAWDPRHGILLK